MKTIDLSQIKSGQEFAEIISNSGECFFQLINEEKNPVLNKMNDPEPQPKFKIGDKVCMDKELLKFNGLEYEGEKYIVTGLESVGDQFLYHLKDENDEHWSFFGYELERA